jgi:hypothetical protein
VRDVLPRVASVGPCAGEAFVRVPRIAGLGPPMPALVGMPLAGRGAPLANRFGRRRETACPPPCFDRTRTRAETAGEPDRVTAARAWEARGRIAGEGWSVRAPRLAHQTSARQAAQRVDKSAPMPASVEAMRRTNPPAPAGCPPAYRARRAGSRTMMSRLPLCLASAWACWTASSACRRGCRRRGRWLHRAPRWRAANTASRPRSRCRWR